MLANRRVFLLKVGAIYRLHSVTEEIVFKRMKEVQARHDSKLDRLRKSKVSVLGRRPEAKLDPVTNLSNHVLTIDERKASTQDLYQVYPN
jgi:ABC-type dipeptide/oligopeptide/nickel transport system ATPase component